MKRNLFMPLAEVLIMNSPDTTAYAAICAGFSALTDMKYYKTGVCCTQVDKHGAPKCCYTLTSGECSLTFTDMEMGIMNQLPGAAPKDNGVWYKWLESPAMWVAEVRNVKKMRQSLKDGFLAKTLECVSHPTRPVINNGQVTGVVAVKDCMTEYALDQLKENGKDFLWLWKQAVERFGVKPYYITHGIEDLGKFEWIYDELTDEDNG